MANSVSEHKENLDRYEGKLVEALALLAQSFTKLREMKARAKDKADMDETLKADAAEVEEALAYIETQKTISRIPPPPIWPC